MAKYLPVLLLLVSTVGRLECQTTKLANLNLCSTFKSKSQLKKCVDEDFKVAREFVSSDLETGPFILDSNYKLMDCLEDAQLLNKKKMAMFFFIRDPQTLELAVSVFANYTDSWIRIVSEALQGPRGERPSILLQDVTKNMQKLPNNLTIWISFTSSNYLQNAQHPYALKELNRFLTFIHHKNLTDHKFGLVLDVVQASVTSKLVQVVKNLSSVLIYAEPKYVTPYTYINVSNLNNFAEALDNDTKLTLAVDENNPNVIYPTTGKNEIEDVTPPYHEKSGAQSISVFSFLMFMANCFSILTHNLKM